MTAGGARVLKKIIYIIAIKKERVVGRAFFVGFFCGKVCGNVEKWAGEIDGLEQGEKGCSVFVRVLFGVCSGKKYSYNFNK